MPLDFREIIESIAIYSGHLLFTGHRYASEHLFAKLTDKVWYQGHYYFDFTILWLLLSLMNTLHTWTIHMLSSQIPKRSASLIFLPIFLIGLSHFYGIINIPLQLLFLWLAACLWFCFNVCLISRNEKFNEISNVSFGLCVFVACLERPSHQNKHYFLIFSVNLYFITYWIHFCLWSVIKLINCFHMLECHYTIMWLLSPSLI